MSMALFGGLLIGLGASILWFASARVAGVSGILRDAVRSGGADRTVSLAFLLGLVVAGAALGPFMPAISHSSSGVVVLAGVLVGFGARVSGGCTSGHGVCGLSRLSGRSLVATMTFMAAGAATVFVMRHVVAQSLGVVP